MKKGILWIIIFTLCLGFAGCGEKEKTALVSSLAVSSSPVSSVITPATPAPDPGPALYQNPLTGIYELEETARNKRPVAIMINNMDVAQKVQTGLNQADMIYECYVEGGITRLMAVYYDLSKVEKIGTIRSARYTFVQLAEGLGAAYIHNGSDQVYTKPYMRELGIDRIDLIMNSQYSFREENGLAFEHTLFTTGELLTKGFEDKEIPLQYEEITPNAFSFAENPQTYQTPCNKVTYVMSSSYTTTFAYNAATQKYIRMPLGEEHKDGETDEATATDNLFILYAKSPLFEDEHHLRTILTQGEGIYVTKGTCTPITWEKGDADDPLKFYTESGEELQVNPGKSWIAFPTTSNQEKTVIES